MKVIGRLSALQEVGRWGSEGEGEASAVMKKESSLSFSQPPPKAPPPSPPPPPPPPSSPSPLSVRRELTVADSEYMTF